MQVSLRNEKSLCKWAKLCLIYWSFFSFPNDTCIKKIRFLKSSASGHLYLTFNLIHPKKTTVIEWCNPPLGKKLLHRTLWTLNICYPSPDLVQIKKLTHLKLPSKLGNLFLTSQFTIGKGTEKSVAVMGQFKQWKSFKNFDRLSQYLL